jgi:signal transduction histidine kinase/CheY-like chemotaxis protein/PAS domain-containing protein
VTLLERAKHLSSLLGPDDILSYLCREILALTGATLAVGSYVPVGEPWQRGLHVAVRERSTTATPAMISAAFAVHHRLTGRTEPLELRRSDETAAIFRALSAESGPQALLAAVPILNRRQRLIAQAIVFWGSEDALVPAVRAEMTDLAILAAIALENAQRLAFARRDQDRLMLLAEATEEALWDWNLETNAFWWGGGIQNIVKHGGELIGTTARWKFDRVHPEDAARVRGSIGRAMKSSDPVWREEYRFRRGDGSWAIVEDRGYFLRDASGHAYRLIGAMRDISDKNRLEVQQEFLGHASAALAESLDVERNLETAARLAAGTVADWCCIVLFEAESENPRTIVVAHHDAARAQRVRALLGEVSATPDVLAGGVLRAQVVSNFTGEHRRAVLARAPAVAAVLDDVALRSVLHVPLVSGSRVLGSITLVTTAESMRTYYHATDLLFAEELARRCVVGVEMARLYEQAQNAIHARDAFMAVLGHELRNPLSPITAALHLMKLRDPRSTREQEVIERQVKHLTRLVDDLLDVSRIERGKIELTKRPVQLAEIVTKAVEIASPLFEERRQRLELNVPSKGMALLADETRIAQVMANLLTNAARYSGEGGHIVVSACRAEQDVVLRVRDNGIGIEPELLPRVFDLFVQGPRTPDRRLGGLGLGLSLVRSLVALHGGTVEAHSEGLGKGSEFVVRLPALPVEFVDAEIAPVAPPPPAATGRRILLVDDNVDAALLLSELLRMLGNDVAVAHDGPEALDLAPCFAPQVAILDIGLPVMDGYELALRLVAGLAQRPFLIALTGYGQEHDRARARQAGFDEHMVKPVDPERLISVLESVPTSDGMVEAAVG